MTTGMEMLELVHRLTEKQAQLLCHTLNSLAVLASKYDLSKPFNRTELMEIAETNPELHSDFIEWAKDRTDEFLQDGLRLMQDISTAGKMLHLADCVQRMHSSAQ